MWSVVQSSNREHQCANVGTFATALRGTTQATHEGEKMKLFHHPYFSELQTTERMQQQERCHPAANVSIHIHLLFSNMHLARKSTLRETLHDFPALNEKQPCIR